MTDQDNNRLYSEALTAAEQEATELNQEISQLRNLLLQLEARKASVDDVCGALQRWVELSGGQATVGDDPFESILEDQGGTIRLSEEEVSLIAYPDGPPEDAVAG